MLLMPFIPKAPQKSFLNKRLFHLPTTYYHILEGNTATLWNSQQFMTEQNAAGNSANGGNDFSSGKSSIYFPPRYHFAAALSKGGSWTWTTLLVPYWRLSDGFTTTNSCPFCIPFQAKHLVSHCCTTNCLVQHLWSHLPNWKEKKFFFPLFLSHLRHVHTNPPPLFWEELLRPPAGGTQQCFLASSQVQDRQHATLLQGRKTKAYQQ